MQLRIHTQAELATNPDRSFDIVTDSQNFPQFFLASGPIPGVARSERLQAEPGLLEHRNVYMTDGSVVLEQVTRLERPKRYDYRWLSSPKPPLQLLLRAAESEWTFEPSGSRTRAVWAYTFTLTSPLAYPAVFAFAQIFKRWMDAGLKRIVAHADSVTAERTAA
jgi:uncharacterized protein YndB with AHSA1/START domain